MDPFGPMGSQSSSPFLEQPKEVTRALQRRRTTQEHGPDADQRGEPMSLLPCDGGLRLLGNARVGGPANLVLNGARIYCDPYASAVMM